MQNGTMDQGTTARQRAWGQQLRLFAAVLGAVVLAGCGADDSTPAAKDTAATDSAADAVDAAPQLCHPLDNELRLNHVQALGTHNSYHKIPASTIADFQYEHSPLGVQLAQEGVRSFELDLHHRGADKPIEIEHIPGLDDVTTCENIADCLGQIKVWSDANPCHHPIVILFEQKDELNLSAVADHWAQFDAEVLAAWPRDRLVTPDDLRGTAPDVNTAALAGQWPTLAQSRGKLLLVIYDKDGSADKYKALHPGLQGAVAFPFGEPGDKDTAVVKRDGALAPDIDALAKAGYLIRTSPGKDKPEVQQALLGGGHVVSTDNPVFKTRDPTIQVQLPGGMPSRCNPITAPANCTAEAINAGVGTAVQGGLQLP